jgi:hypothetical protein
MDNETTLVAGKIPTNWFTSRSEERALRFVSHEDLLDSPNAIYVQIVRDSWWSVHPTLGYIFAGKSPQCNVSKVLARRLTDRLYPGADVRFVHRALVPIDLRDFL